MGLPNKKAPTTKNCRFYKTSVYDPARVGLANLKKNYFLKIPKWQHKLVREYKRGKLISYFLNDAAKTSAYGLKISENFQIKHAFLSKKYFFISVIFSTQITSARLRLKLSLS